MELKINIKFKCNVVEPFFYVPLLVPQPFLQRSSYLFSHKVFYLFIFCSSVNSNLLFPLPVMSFFLHWTTFLMFSFLWRPSTLKRACPWPRVPCSYLEMANEDVSLIQHNEIILLFELHDAIVSIFIKQHSLPSIIHFFVYFLKFT